MPVESANLPDSYAELKVFTLSLIEDLKRKAFEVEALKFQLFQLRRWRFGKQSEQLDAEQLALWQAELDADIAVLERKLGEGRPAEAKTPAKRVPKREPLPDWLPRVEHRHEAASCTCQACGSVLVNIGEEVSEQLDLVPAKFFVHRHIRPKLVCRQCETVLTPLLPSQPIDKGLPAPGLLAQVIIAKYADHCPLHRQEGIYARLGVELSRSTMAGWVGQLQVSLEPLVDTLRGELRSEVYLQADETTVPVLAPGTGRTATGYLWAYRSGPWSERQAVVFDFQANRGQQWPKQFLRGFAGILQVDGYAGYHEVFRSGPVIEAGCVAHARRKFFEVHEATKSPVAQYALLEIGKLYAIEAEAKELKPAERAALRQARAGPILAGFKPWLEQTLAQAPPRSALAKAIGYSLNRWPALLRYLDDGLLSIDNNPIERTLRGVALGRKNYLFACSESGGQCAALIYSLIESAKLNRLDPYAYFVDILTKLPTCRAGDLPALLPYRWQPDPAVPQRHAA